MDIRILSANNGYLILDDREHTSGMIRSSESTYVAKDVEDLCYVIKKIYRTREEAKKPGLEIKKGSL